MFKPARNRPAFPAIGARKVQPKKQLGQHFLTDLSIAERIASSLKGDRAPETLEVGPGMGVLTRFLLNRNNLQLSAAEIDPESVDYLRENLPELKDRLIYADFLQMNLAERFPQGVNVIGNFPYNISSQIFFKVLEYRDRVPEVVGMLQREVAIRLAEPPGSRDYGILSVFLQAFYDIEYLFTVSEHVFDPPPKVKSGVIRLVRNDVKQLDCDEKLFFRVVKTTFNQRRKTIRNSLRAGFPELQGEHRLFTERPEQLSVTDFVELTRWVERELQITNYKL
jgi:16S rRNA (adenine1518-N6/adenine1519-N6)-dimethyltransferase